MRCLSAHESSLRDPMDLVYAEGKDALAAALAIREVVLDQLAKSVQLGDEAAEAAHALASGQLRIPRERRKKDVRDRLIIKVMNQIKETFPKLSAATTTKRTGSMISPPPTSPCERFGQTVKEV